MVASAVGITLGIVLGIATLVVTVYCIIRRRMQQRRRRPFNGGSAGDYFGQSDFAGPISLLPPTYNSAVPHAMDMLPAPPPYRKDEAPPQYEMIALTTFNVTEVEEPNEESM